MSSFNCSRGLGTEEAEELKWTSSGVLGKSGVCVRNDSTFEYYLHEESDVELYGFCYGTKEEAEKRGMKKISGSDQPTGPQSKL